MNTTDSISPAIVLYTNEDNSIQLDVKLEGETVWLSQQQMALLFDTDRTSLLRHIKNIYTSGELDETSTCAKIAQVRLEGKRRVERTIPFYNLDVIISVGYRVNSRNATKFRQWANQILKDYLVKGYAVNQKITQQRYEELKDVVRLMSRTYQLQESVSSEEADGLLSMMGDYVYALDTLDHYDHQQLSVEKPPPKNLSMPPMRTPWRPSDDSSPSSAAAHSSPTRRTTPSRVPSDRFTKPSEGWSSIPLSKKRQPCCSTSSPKTTPSATATSALPPCCSSSSWTATRCYTPPTDTSA
uniref:Putative cytochrome C biogenesis protein CycH n=1 Tax=uncultured bacterium fosmid pJB17E7_contig I TaxID=1478055 RepID=A0A0H3U7A3_9BACT|nr:putative cytochrome C biogenesis protein CycH [uncultured bacterium fosmid pJB17E7_contig I]